VEDISEVFDFFEAIDYSGWCLRNEALSTLDRFDPARDELSYTSRGPWGGRSEKLRVRVSTH